MTIDLHRSMERRRTAAHSYQLAEREFQAVYDFSGEVGTLPVEAEVEIPFTVIFMIDSGRLRDSNLDRPHAKLTVEVLYAPVGCVPYHYVKRWEQDPDLNYVGAIVMVGMHCPAMFIEGRAPLGSRAFAGKLHAAFQGYGVLIDDENSLGLTATGDAAFTNMDMGVG